MTGYGSLSNTSSTHRIKPKYSDLTVIIPVFNEPEPVASFIFKVKEIAKTIILVDNGSTDETVRIAEYANPDYILKITPKADRSKAIQTGLEYAKQIQSSYVTILYVCKYQILDVIPEVMDPFLADTESDICFGIYENVYDQYKDYQKSGIEHNDHLMINPTDIVLGIFKISAVKSDRAVVSDREETILDLLQTGKKVKLVRVNQTKPFKIQPRLITTTILIFFFGVFAYSVFMTILVKIFPALFFAAPILHIAVITIIAILALIKYSRDVHDKNQ